jgi:PAS domain S-box-containing protein
MTGVREKHRVLYVESDPDIRETLADYLDEVDDIDTISVGGGQRALDKLGESVDCVITGLPVDGDSWARLVDHIPSTVPLVLYTDHDPTTIASSVLSRADSLVERGSDQHQAFLVRKIRSVTGGTPRSEPRRRTDAKSLAAERTTGLDTFLIDNSGTVVWSSSPFETVFPGTDTPSEDDFYEHLSVVLADQPTAASSILALRDSDTVREGALLSIPLDTGGRRDVVHCSFPLPDKSGVARIELFQDLTVGRERKERLLLFETLVMGTQDGLYTLDANGTIDFCNPAMAEQLGYTREDLLGRHASEVMAEGELEYGQRVVQDLIDDPERQNTVYDMVFVTKDGERRDVSLNIQLLPSPDDSYAGLVGVMRDVTARKERKRELERFETIIQALGDPVYATNGDGELIYVNEAFERKTGYSASEVLGQHGALVLDDDSTDTMQMVVQRLMEGDQPTETVELTVVTADGSRFPAEVHTALLPTDDGNFNGNAGVVRDITERKRREERLEEFTSVVAHDLRSPLAVGQGNLDLYRQTGEEKRLDKVENALEEMEHLIDDLLELARHGDVIGETEAVDLEATARDAWQQLQTRGATLTCDCTGTVQADRDRLRQAFENLFGNSVEHGSTSNRPQADNSVEHSSETVDVTVTRIPNGFAVADSGPGIPPEERKQVFDRGYTTAEKGTGFGLAIVEEIVNAHGWTIDVTESADGGARFEITGVDFD